MWRTVCCACLGWVACLIMHAGPTFIRRRISGCPSIRLGPLLGLPFAERERRYPVFAARLTHQEYTSCYLACRLHATPDLLSLLRTLSPHGKIYAA